MSASNELQLIAQTRKWVESVVIAHNYCPFAKRELVQGKVRFKVCHQAEFNQLLELVIQECVYLDQNSETETTLIIIPEGFSDFNLFLGLLGLAENLMVAQGYEGIYQLASFHPDYCFQGAEIDDAANYTNRSPYPMLHLIREASIEQAIKHHPSPDSIPERNIEYAREQGLVKMQNLLAACIAPDK